MTLISTYENYYFGSDLPLNDRQLARLGQVFSSPPPQSSSVLGGRRPVSFHEIEGLGPVVVKCYTRGGLIRHLVAARYLKWGKTRCQKEYEILQQVERLGIRVPAPLVYACQGRLFYRAWLVTREIPGALNLARLSLENEKRARFVMKLAIEQVSKLIANNVQHADLHPGNIVIDRNDSIYLVDFDKGRFYSRSREKLKAYYLARWKRAVIKHRLPVVLDEMMCAGLK
jgi:3-deoxy-D-manno-octulosonic acid kinase